MVGQSEKLGFQSSAYALKDGHTDTDCASFPAPVFGGKVVGPHAFGFSPELRSHMSREIGSADLIHVHGLWMYPGILAASLSRTKACKRVVSPHGMLEPWALGNSPWKKRLAGWLFERKNLTSAHCLHALCANEARSFREFGLSNPIAVIPNGVELDELAPRPDPAGIWRKYPELPGRKIFLFLSRVHPKKGLPDFLHAWREARAHEQNWALVVVGPDELSHEAELRKLAGEMGIASQVTFAGPAYGEEKRAFLALANAFVLPSLSEGFSMAVLEAAAAGLPVLLTRECNFPELATAGAAIEVPAGRSGILAGLRRFLNLTEAERQQMGGRGLELVKKTYTWTAVGLQMKSVYDWLQAGGSRPDCVQL
jgi:poly(glycerol-phosphate) alpha-glucosyltransferase